jgi:hypothetical protein
MKMLQMLLSRLPPRLATLVSHVLSLMAGVLAAVILHYVLYRIDLPSKPFIYVAF